jgi:hypothetical protein
MFEMKYLSALAIFFLLSCDKSAKKSNREYDQALANKWITVICLNGVKYYSYNMHYAYSITPVFNKDTKQVELCEVGRK